ncbi:hypothetical protein D3C84_1105370 [compost metagenome]
MHIKQATFEQCGVLRHHFFLIDIGAGHQRIDADRRLPAQVVDQHGRQAFLEHRLLLHLHSLAQLFQIVTQILTFGALGQDLAGEEEGPRHGLCLRRT